MIIEVTGKLVLNYRSIERDAGKKAWCELPYPGHKKGCPNYKKCAKLPRLPYYFDLIKPHWFAIWKFDLEAQVHRMKEKHPQWSYRQCKNVYYWQNGVRKHLHTICKNFIGDQNLTYHLVPEAMGLHVMRTLKKINISIEIKPIKMVTKVALIGTGVDGKELLYT